MTPMLCDFCLREAITRWKGRLYCARHAVSWIRSNPAVEYRLTYEEAS